MRIAVYYSKEEGKGLEGSISFIALLIFNRSIVLVLRLFYLFACLLFRATEKVAKRSRAFEKRGKQFIFYIPIFGNTKLYVRRA